MAFVIVRGEKTPRFGGTKRTGHGVPREAGRGACLPGKMVVQGTRSRPLPALQLRARYTDPQQTTLRSKINTGTGPGEGPAQEQPRALPINPQQLLPTGKPGAEPPPGTHPPTARSLTHQREEVGVTVLQAGPVRHPVRRRSHDPRRAGPPRRGMSGGTAGGRGARRATPGATPVKIGRAHV